MAWTGLTLTVDGRNALNKSQLSNTMNFKSIVVGDGDEPDNYGTRTKLVHQLYEITDLKIDIVDGGCVITADFPKVDFDYYFREIGIIITTDEGDKLYVYDNCGDDAQFIVNSTGVESNQKRLLLSLAISGVSQITVSTPSVLYVAYDKFEQALEELHQDKVDKVDGKGLSSNDYTTEEKTKLKGIAEGANNYTHPNSGATAGTYRSVTVNAQGHVTKGSNPTVTVEDGGTGATTAKGAEFNILSGMTSVSTEINDSAQIVCAYASPTDTQGRLYWRKASLLWDYIKSKISSVLGLTETNYSGTANKAKQDGNGNVIADTYTTKEDMEYIALAESLGWMRAPVIHHENGYYYTKVPVKSYDYYYLVKLNNGAIYRMSVTIDPTNIKPNGTYSFGFSRENELIIGTDVGIGNNSYIDDTNTGKRAFPIKEDDGRFPLPIYNAVVFSTSPDIVSWYCEIPIDGNGTVKDMISQSSAITEKGQYALDAIEKNASVSGTLANLLGTLTTQHNSLATDVGDTKWHFSNTSYKDTVGTVATNGIHGILDAKIHASISTLSSGIYSFSNSGPMYHVLLFKYTDNYYSGLCFGYDTSRLVLFRYVNNGTTKTFYTRYV